jgi:hypothetical protein
MKSTKNNEAYTPLLQNTTLVDWFRAGLFGIAVPIGNYYLLGGLASIFVILVLAGMYTILLKRDKPITYLLLIEAGVILMGFLVFGLIVALGMIAAGMGA